jgi:peptide/nickel transport system substrate-binding protein
VLPTAPGVEMGPMIGVWYQTGGAEGMEPEGKMLEAFELFEQAYTVPTEERIRLGQEIWKMHLDEVWTIGTVGVSPASMGVRVTNVNLGNVPERLFNSPHMKNPAGARPQTFYYKN